MNIDKTVLNKYRIGSFSHAYILSGTNTAERDTLAETMAAAMVCSGNPAPCGTCPNCRKAALDIHPDIEVIAPEKDSEIYVNQIRTLVSDAAVMPNDAEKKVYIIRQAEKMNPPAQNALLKVLEEPPTHCRFILTTENSGLLLQTVRSRCVELRIAEEDAPVNENQQAVQLLDVFLNGDEPSITAACFSMEKLNRNELFRLFGDIKLLAMHRLREAVISDSMTAASRLTKIIGILSETDEYFTYNVGVGHIVGLLLAGLV